MFLSAEIDCRGYIDVVGPTRRQLVHRDTRNIQDDFVCVDSITDAKERLKIQYSNGDCRGIVQLTRQGGVERIFAYKEDIPTWTERLKYFKGCYGTWPLARMNH